MLKKRVEEALNTQINAEMWSAHFFLAMSLHFAEDGYTGFAAWMRHQYNEEQQQAFRLMDYVVEQGGRVILQDIVDIPSEFGDPIETFEQALVHQMRITDSFDTLLDVVCEEKDRATRSVLDWFVLNQVKKESEISRIITRLKRTADESGFYMLDSELIKKS
ncbi:ferritin [Coprobacter sp.]